LTETTHSTPEATAEAAAGLRRTAHLQRLLDVYGAMLTGHQRDACHLHLDEDWSFTELAEHLGCSRSGAHDLVRRALTQLEHLEERLGLAAELARRDEVEAALRARLAHRLADLRSLETEGPAGVDPADVHPVDVHPIDVRPAGVHHPVDARPADVHHADLNPGGIRAAADRPVGDV